MSSSQVVTTNEGEGQSFDFNKWIIDNKLTELKQVFIGLDMTTSCKLNTISPEFGQLMRDPQLLAKPHLIPTVMDALYKVPKIVDNHNYDNKPKIVLVCLEEEQSINKLNKYDDNISILIQQLNKSNVDGIKDIKDLEHCIDSEFDEIYNKLQNRRQEIQNMLVDIEKQQKSQFIIKSKELNEKQLNIKDGIKSCYSLVENQNIDRITRKKEIISIRNSIDNDIKFDVENDKLIPNNKININFDLKNELIQNINKFGAISISSSLSSLSSINENKSKMFQYESDLDKNGIIYYLGTKYIDSENQWINPLNLSQHKKDKKQKMEIINISSTTLEKGNNSSQFIERKYIKKFKTKNVSHSFFIIDFNKIKIKPNCYTLRHSSPYGYYLRFWSFQGFNIDNNEWETIKQHINDNSFNNKNKTKSFTLNCHTFYSQFRIIMNQKNTGDHFGLSGSDWTLCCCGFELYGEAMFPIA